MFNPFELCPLFYMFSVSFYSYSVCIYIQSYLIYIQLYLAYINSLIVICVRFAQNHHFCIRSFILHVSSFILSIFNLILNILWKFSTWWKFGMYFVYIFVVDWNFLTKFCNSDLSFNGNILKHPST